MCRQGSLLNLVMNRVLQVDVGDFLRFKSCVLYTETENLEQPRIHVEVIAHVTRPEVKSSEVICTSFRLESGHSHHSKSLSVDACLHVLFTDF